MVLEREREGSMEQRRFSDRLVAVFNWGKENRHRQRGERRGMERDEEKRGRRGTESKRKRKRKRWLELETALDRKGKRCRFIC